MFEIAAYASGVNVAENKDATQSSTFKSFQASNANDGDTSSFSHTNDGDAWLEIDFGQAEAIESVDITNVSSTLFLLFQTSPTFIIP